jgi:hypothetical protein
MALKDEVVNFAEYTLSIDKFNRPQKLINEDAIMTVICRLLLLNPGTMPDHPDMGVGLVSRWRYSDTSELIDLEREIQRQMQKFLPQFQGAEVSLSTHSENNKMLVISMKLDDKMFVFKLNENNTLDMDEL